MKRLLFIISILLSANSLQAQVNKEVEVTRAYIPRVVEAQKPLLKATIVDSTYINPEINYDITPLMINTQLLTLPIKPATVTYWEYNRPLMGQIKIGAGYPFNSLLQGYVSTHNASVGYLAANVDHCGNYSKITNNIEEKSNAAQSTNDVNLAGGLYVAGRTLGAQAHYSNDLYQRYAFKQHTSSVVNYQEIGALLYFGDDFVDLSRLNFNISGGYSYLLDRDRNSDRELKISTLAGQEFTLGNVMLCADFMNIDRGDLYNNDHLSLSLSLEKELADWQLLVGAKYIYDKTEISGAACPNHYVIPTFTLKNRGWKTISPYAQMGGSVQQNSFANLLEKNPYIKSELSGESCAEYYYTAGFAGNLAQSTFAYDLNVSYQTALNTTLWGAVIVYNGTVAAENIYESYFDMEQANLNTTSFNARLSYMPFSNLSISADAHYYLYNLSGADQYVNSRPDFDATLALEYNLRHMTFGVKGNVIGKRDFSVLELSASATPQIFDSVELPVAVDVSAFVDWRLKDKLSIFVEGSNLCNAELYPWAYYRGFGVQFTAGAKIKF